MFTWANLCLQQILHISHQGFQRKLLISKELFVINTSIRKTTIVLQPNILKVSKKTKLFAGSAFANLGYNFPRIQGSEINFSPILKDMLQFNQLVVII